MEDYASFEKISRAGRDIAELHFEPEPNVESMQTEADYKKYEVLKVRQSDDKTKLLFYNRQGDIFHTLDIPLEVEKWEINGSRVIYWLEKMYKVSVDDKATGRINVPNDYAREYGNHRYTIELAENVIKIAVRTVKILYELNKIEVEI